MQQVFFFQAEDGIRDAQESRGLGDVYKRQLLFSYYDGRQPLVYSTERLRAAFQSLDARFNENLSLIHI